MNVNYFRLFILHTFFYSMKVKEQFKFVYVFTICYYKFQTLNTCMGFILIKITYIHVSYAQHVHFIDLEHKILKYVLYALFFF